MTTRHIQRERTIKESDFLQYLPEWVDASKSITLQGLSEVDEVVAQAIEFRRKMRRGEATSLSLHEPTKAAELCYALCRVLTEDCEGSPRSALEDAAAVRELLEASRWQEDEFEERAELLCSFAFISWRSARMLSLSREAQHWEGEYRKAFRNSLRADVVGRAVALDEGSDSTASEELLECGPETVFQTLLYLQDELEACPRLVGDAAIALRRALEAGKGELPSDLVPYFLGETARLEVGALRSVGRPGEMEHWLRVAERDFQKDVDSRPQLARVALSRLGMLYGMCRWDLILAAAPALDQSFADLGMEEDRARLRIVWAASLKVTDRCREALEILEPLRESRSAIRPAIYGWMLLHSGDTHQICGDHERALAELTEAASLLKEGRQYTALAHVNSMISGIYRAYGLLQQAIELLKSSQHDLARLGMTGMVANHRMLVAETYLAAGRYREAEEEIRAALPVLEEHGMLVDSVAAVNILREAIRQQRLEPTTLREARERFRPKR